MYRKSQVSFLEGMSSTNQWCVPDEVHDVLAVDFDRSLSGLEVDLCTSSNNMSSAVFAVPEMPRKEDMHNSLNPSTADTFRCLQDISGDVVSNHGPIEVYPVTLVNRKKNRYSIMSENDCTNSVKRFCFNGKEMEPYDSFESRRCRPHSLSAPEIRTTSSHIYSGQVINTILSQVVQLPVMPAPQTVDQGNQGPPSAFLCILVAPTSIATKINEETLTYLNQGQPYEICIKKNMSFPYHKTTLFKSIIQIGFQERRLQYMEKEQIKEWQTQRYGERILEIDLPLSFGLLEAVNSPNNVNQCEFLWDSNVDVSVFLKVNCISTEFTPKKHGGEKGVPFRIVIDTYAHNQPSEKIHSASCQVKIFKPKGADRKHKTDREKMSKRLQGDKEKYHPQYEYTTFRDICLSESWPVTHANVSAYVTNGNSSTPSSPISSGCSPQNSPLECILESPQKDCFEGSHATSPIENQDNSDDSCGKFSALSYDSSVDECAMWLQRNMFSSYIKEFVNFNGADILNLTRADLIDICGTANGIRLYNTLHSKGNMELFFRLPSTQAYSAIYLKTPTLKELAPKIKLFCGLPVDSSCDFYVSGPAGARVVLTDEVVSNMQPESLFTVERIDGSCDERLSIVLEKQRAE